MKFRRLLPLLVFAVVPLAPVRAQITGFGTNGGNFSLNKGQAAAGPTVNAAGTTATLTSGVSNQGNSLFSNAINIGSAFNVTFDYQNVNANGSMGTADGFTFTLQTASRTAVGYDGNQLGFGTNQATPGTNETARGVIKPSVAVGFNVYNTSTTGLLIGGNLTGGNVGTLPNNTGNGVVVTGTGPSLYSGDVIRVTLAYSGTTLTETLTDVTNALVPSKSFSYTVDVAGTLGNTSSVFVGFTGSTGGASSTQTISNFSFTPVPEPATWAAGGLTLLAGGVVLRRRYRPRSE